MQIIEFTGTPKSGKTALIKRFINHFGEDKAVPVYDGYRKCSFKDKKERIYEQQVWTINSIVNKILEFKNSDKKPAYLIIDRGLWDSKIFIEFIKNKRFLNGKQYKYLSGVLNPFLGLTDRVFYFKTDPKISHKRQAIANNKPRNSVEELERLDEIAQDILPKDTIQLDGGKSKDELFREIIAKLGVAT